MLQCALIVILHTIMENQRLSGEATEVAIVNSALELGENKDEIYRKENRINEIPFDSKRKLMTTIHKVGNKYRIITKMNRQYPRPLKVSKISGF